MLIDQITDWGNMIDAFYKTRKGQCKHKIDAIRFNNDWIINLRKLQKEILSGDYEILEYTNFKVYEPKERIIHAPKYRDKIVQHAVNNVIRDFYEPKFIHDSYACIRGKGTQRAIKAIQKHAQRSTKTMSDPCFIKLDIRKFFYTIDHDVMKNILAKKIKCLATLSLLYKMIDSSPDDVGLPLGNLTSQPLANVLLNEMDQYCKRTLKLKHYVRYADDILAIVEKEDVKCIMDKMKLFLNDSLKLEVAHGKCYSCPVPAGISNLGMKIMPSHISLLGKHKRAARKMDKENNDNSINSWLSFAGIASCFNFCNSLPNIRRHIL